MHDGRHCGGQQAARRPAVACAFPVPCLRGTPFWTPHGAPAAVNRLRAWPHSTRSIIVTATPFVSP
eukprot:6201553-Pleurochrysis_carterae.AAC.1